MPDLCYLNEPVWADFDNLPRRARTALVSVLGRERRLILQLIPRWFSRPLEMHLHSLRRDDLYLLPRL